MKLITFTVPCYNSAAYMDHCGNVAHKKSTLSGAARSATGSVHNSSIPIVG